MCDGGDGLRTIESTRPMDDRLQVKSVVVSNGMSSAEFTCCIQSTKFSITRRQNQTEPEPLRCCVMSTCRLSHFTQSTRKTSFISAASILFMSNVNYFILYIVAKNL